jgi:hypothetical protein
LLPAIEKYAKGTASRKKTGRCCYFTAALAVLDDDQAIPHRTVFRSPKPLVMFTGSRRIRILIDSVLENPHFDPAGHHVGHAQMVLGLLYKGNMRITCARNS